MITTKKSVLPQTEGLVEMNWDPITRIVGSLGIFTKIDFKNKQVAECYSTSSIFRGYSVFMKNKDPRDAHFITSRICGICGDNHATCAVYTQNMAFGIKTPPLGEWIINLGEAAEYMFDHNIFQDNLVGVERARLSHDCRHYDRAQSVHRRILSRNAGGEPQHS
jgi:hydrogenase large subunit